MASGRAAAVLVTFLALTFLFKAEAAEKRVNINGISLHHGSKKGGTQVKVFGWHFPKHFSMTYDVVSVYLESTDLDARRYPATVEKTSVSDRQIECYTPAMPVGDYRVEVKVCESAEDCSMHTCDAPQTEEDCLFTTSNWRTPFLESTSSSSYAMYPGSMFEAYGRIVTCLHGTETARCTNGRTERITRCYQENAGQACLLRDPETNDLYGIGMDDDGESFWGTMNGKLQGSFVGPQNITIIVSDGFGRSGSNQLLCSNLEMCNLETYSKVSSVGPRVGGEEGGSEMTIGGAWFDSTTQDVDVTVGGVECQKQGDVTDEGITCLTPPKPADRDHYPGNRGAYRDTWVYGDAASMPALTDGPTGDPTEDREWSHSLSWEPQEEDRNYISKSEVFFQPPDDNTYQFALSGCNKPADDFLVRFQDDSGEVSTWSCPDSGWGWSPRMELSAANSYYMEVWYRHEASDGGNTDDSQAARGLTLRMSDTDYVQGQNVPARNEKQHIAISSTVHREKQLITPGDRRRKRRSGEFTLTHDGVTTEPISAGASASEVQAKLQQIYEFQCPDAVVNPNPSITLYATGYESDSVPPWHTGTRVKSDETLPFCGGSCLQNPTTIYKEDDDSSLMAVKISSYRQMCFAYKGALASELCVVYRHGEERQEEEVEECFGPEDDSDLEFSSNEEWQCRCTDLFDLFTTIRPSATNVEIKEIKLGSSGGEFFIDMLYIGKVVPMECDEVVKNRRSPAMPNGVMVDEVQVEEESGEYTVTSVVFNCGYNMPLLKAIGGWTASRLVAGSPPVTGSFDMTFNDLTSTVPAGATREEMTNILRADLGIQANVTLGGDCYGYEWAIEMYNGGDQPQLQLDGGNLNGDGVEIEGSTKQDGCLWFSLIPEHTLRTSHDTPQVVVTTNGILSRCEGNCDYSWAADKTPTTSSITPGEGLGGTVVTITGTGFSTNCNDMRVMIGHTEDTEEGVACTPTVCTETSITCTTGAAGRGRQRVKVKVLPHGDANPNGKASGDVHFTYLGEITGNSQTTCGLGGGLPHTITGNGLGAEDVPKVGENNCPVTSRSDTEIVCTIPPASAGTLDVTLHGPDDTVLTAPQQITMDEALTPIIESYDPEEVSVAGGPTLTIVATGIGDSPTLALRSEDGETVSLEASVTDSGSVTATLPSLPPDDYDILLFVPGKGCAVMRDDSAGRYKSATLSVPLKVSGMDVTQGSSHGGTLVTIEGKGFSVNKEDNEVNFGDIDCEVQTSSTTELTCITGSTATTHTVTNDGAIPEYGPGFAWVPQSFIINVGDTVEWKWASRGGDTKYGVRQTTDASGKTLVAGGFNSGEQTSEDPFSHTFHEEDTVFFTSGYVDENQSVQLIGKVTVVPLTDETKAMSVKVHGKEAKYVGSGNRRRRSTGGSCPGSTAALSTCSGSTPAVPGGAVYGFTYRPCLTAVVSSVSPNTGPAGTTITITGGPFSTVPCENEVLIGGYPCDIQSASSTSLTCEVNPTSSSGNMPVETALPITVNVKNRGYARMAVDTDTYTLLPKVTSVSPTTGSTAGGTLVTISGSGFAATQDDTTVRIGSSECDIQTLAYDQIVCETRPAAVSTLDVTVTQTGTDHDAICDGTCQFGYKDSATPRLISIDPDETSAPTTDFTIQGVRLGTSTDDVTVTIGATPCVVTSVTDESIACTAEDILVGSNGVSAHIAGQGNAASTLHVTSNAEISSLAPNSGSLEGGLTITIEGNGFGDDTSVTIGGNVCEINAPITPSRVTCVTPSEGDSTVPVSVRSNGQQYTPAYDFTYSQANTPTVTGISPADGTGGTVVTITGSGFTGPSGSRKRRSAFDVAVAVGDAPCPLTWEPTDTSISCTLGDRVAGSGLAVAVTVEGKGLASSAGVSFDYQLALTDVQPARGSFGGGLPFTLAGNGFSASTVATVCDQPCPISSFETSELQCALPAHTVGSADVDCAVKVADNGVTATLDSAFTYDPSLTARISSVSPDIGGTAGGTPLTITGTNLGDITGVTIGGSECTDLTKNGDTEMTCVTGAHEGSVRTTVQANSASGLAVQDGADFFYADRWSSVYTWGGAEAGLPEEGDFVVIAEGQTMLLDMDTPVLEMLLIEGELIFYDETDVHLQSKYILVIGGRLQVGTEEEPFLHQAMITTVGHLRSQEIPIYGAKCLAVRDGVLDLHGKPVEVPWTRLAATAAAGSATVTVQDDVSDSWNPGDTVVFATTGHRHSQSETETRIIDSVDGHTVTLTEALEHAHLGEQETIGDVTVEFRGEVGLLTRNVVFKGSNNDEWNDVIAACPEGFDTGEFSTQTCFQGRFGEEVGSDEFGGHIMLHSSEGGALAARIENVELTNVGQAFRLGRYPIHFHLAGDQTGSYVKNAAIYRTFNRAVTVHGTNNLVLENNVVAYVKGGALFLEDAVEIGNIFRHNLGVHVTASTSLLNEDITPAFIWSLNPNNTYVDNACAGGSHFCYWYAMPETSLGPSYDPDSCPQHTPLGEFRGNSGHSQGWFCLWSFEDYYPTVDGSCAWGADTETAVFDDFTAWRCEKGIELVNAGDLEVRGALLFDNEKAGVEGKKTLGEGSPVKLTDSTIIGHTLVDGSGVTAGGLVHPFGRMELDNVKFYNFYGEDSVAVKYTSIDGTCGDLCSGFGSTFNNVQVINPDGQSPNKALYRWEHEAYIEDLDGSFTGTDSRKRSTGTPATLAPCSSILDSSCTRPDEFSSGAVPGCVCTGANAKLRRFAFNNRHPGADGKSITATCWGEDGAQQSVDSPWASKRITHKPGWMFDLVADKTCKLAVQDGPDKITNNSYTAAFYDMEEGDYFIMEHDLALCPDIVSTTEGAEESENPLDPSINNNGDYHIDDTGDGCTLSYLVKGEGQGFGQGVTREVNFRAIRCFYEGCIPPPSQDELPPTGRPDDFLIYNDLEWTEDQTDGFLDASVSTADRRKRSSVTPTDESSIRLCLEDEWVVMGGVNVLRKHHIELCSVLELYNPENPNQEYVVEAAYIVIKGYGRLVAGLPDERFQGNLGIYLTGDRDTPELTLPNAPNLGAKTLSVFGGLDLHGKERSPSSTNLAQTATSGANTITVEGSVDWQPDEEIVISSTSFMPGETETRTITGVSTDDSGNSVLTLDRSLQYKHIAITETAGDTTFTMAAKVGLLTRNIKIQGGEYDVSRRKRRDTEEEEAFGARVLVGTLNEQGKQYKGYAWLEDVEFYNTGQLGWDEFYDPRYSLSFLDVGDVTEARPSSLDSCTFHHGFSPAIGVYGTNNLNISNSITSHSVGPAAIVEGSDNRLTGNLFTNILNPDTYQDRDLTSLNWRGAVEITAAPGLVMEDNLVAGSERIGYLISGEPCTEESKWENNEVHSALHGVHVYEKSQPECTKIHGFFTWRCYGYGLYYVSESSLEVDDYLSVDNGLGLYAGITGPPSKDHMKEEKYAKISDSTFKGRTAASECDDGVDMSDKNIKNANGAGGLGFKSEEGGGHIGAAFTVFMSGGPGAPKHPWLAVMSYPTISGDTLFDDVTFANFGACDSKEDFALHTAKEAEDGSHPVRISRASFPDTPIDNRVRYGRPGLWKINPADCVDMSCDGKRKSLLKDLDGSVLDQSEPGYIFPESDWQWDGDTRYGLGYYRTPKTLLTNEDGTRIDPELEWPMKGTYRDASCEKNEGMQAYTCSGTDNYEMLVIESMDADTEERRLSPVALATGGSLTLVNGPQDHGWCAGYTCQERLSTFWLEVATGREYTLHYTGVSPRNSRLQFINADVDENAESDIDLLVDIYYSNPNRLDVFADGAYVEPKNHDPQSGGTVEPGQGHRLTLGDEPGANVFFREEQSLYVAIPKEGIIDIVTSDVIVVAFGLPPVAEADFYVNAVTNLQLFLGVEEGRMRRMNVQAESKKRRRRSTEPVTLEIEIGDPPKPTLDAIVEDSLTYEQLKAMEAELVDAFQTGELATVLGTNLTWASITGPVPHVGTAEWAALTVETVAGVTYAIPASLRVTVEPEPQHEGADFSIQPKIQALDTEGNIITHLGHETSPWEVTATLQLGAGSDLRALLKGTTSVPYVDGWANFTDLQITHSGEDYTIHFTVSKSTQTPLLVHSQLLTVTTKPVTVGMLSQPDAATINEAFSLQLELRDAITGQALPDIAWKGLTWSVDVSLVTPFPGMYNGSLSGNTSVTFSALTGYATFDNILLSHPSRYQLELHISTDQAVEEYDFTFSPEPVDVFHPDFQMPMGVQKAVQITFDADFSAIQELESLFEIFLMNFLNAKYSSVYVSAVDASAGSIVVDFSLTGPLEAVDAVLQSLWEEVNQPLGVTFSGTYMETITVMFVNGEPYYGTGLAPGGLDIAMVASIAAVSALVIIVIVLIFIWRHKKASAGAKKAKWSNFRPSSAIFRPSTASSVIKVKEAAINQPPVVLISSCPLKDVEDQGKKNVVFMQETRLDNGIESRPVSRATPSPRPSSPPGFVDADDEDDDIPMLRNMKVKLLDKAYRRIKLGQTWIDMKKPLDQAREDLLMAFPAQLGGKDFRFLTPNLSHVVTEVESEFRLKDIIARNSGVITLHMV